MTSVTFDAAPFRLARRVTARARAERSAQAAVEYAIVAAVLAALLLGSLTFLQQQTGRELVGTGTRLTETSRS